MYNNNNMSENTNEKNTFLDEGEYLSFSNKIRDQAIEIDKLKSKCDALECELGSSEEKSIHFKDCLGGMSRVLSIVINDLE